MKPIEGNKPTRTVRNTEKRSQWAIRGSWITFLNATEAALRLIAPSTVVDAAICCAQFDSLSRRAGGLPLHEIVNFKKLR